MDTPARSTCAPESRSALTVAEAASIAGRSTSWIRDMITARGLDPVAGSRPLAVTAESLRRLMEHEAERRARPLARRRRKAPNLRLVWSNPNL